MNKLNQYFSRIRLVYALLLLTLGCLAIGNVAATATVMPAGPSIHLISNNSPLSARFISANLIPAAADIGQQGAIWVGADVPNAGFFFRSPAGWQRYSSGEAPALVSGTLVERDVDVLGGAQDVRTFIGTSVYVGYGLNQQDMLNNRKFAMVQVIEAPVIPKVSATGVVDGAIGLAINRVSTATFSQPMDPSTINSATFSVSQGNLPVPGKVTYAGLTATFTPSSNLAVNTRYTSIISTGAADLAGVALASNYVWSWTTGPANPTPPVLGEAGRYVILASQKISTTTGTHIANGDIGNMDQARATYITGFTDIGTTPNLGGLAELTNGWSYAMDDACPAPFSCPQHYATPVVGATWTNAGTMIAQVRTDLGMAKSFLDADSNPSAATQVLATELGGMTLLRGVYKTSANVTIQTGELHLDAQGDPDSVWIFVIGGTFNTGAPFSKIWLDNGAQAKNVYWSSAGETVIGTNTAFSGNVFAQTQVRVLTGASVVGRLFALTGQVTLDANNVTKAP